ncbi:hypothetical protein CRG98_046606 [Punica granatum]|uniref:Prolamin-like domain-containing protein n=1 Tax=Punica granatum TaxID=22663 RepID=A0A2I0HN47_PUNGR|nr:hypothetical protein CRG98_046606 [Punica granatum]
MGLINGFCSLMIILIINIIALSTDLNHVAAQVDFKTCANGTMTKECGHSLGQRVALNTGLPPTDDCCSALVNVGRPCHDAFVQFHVKEHDYVGTKAALLQRGNEIWNDCVDVVKFGFPPAEAPNLDVAGQAVDFKTCANGIMTKQCGESIRRTVAMNEGPPPTDECCAELVMVGKPCHDAYVQERHVKVHDFVGSVADLLRRSDQVWTQCFNSFLDISTDHAIEP